MSKPSTYAFGQGRFLPFLDTSLQSASRDRFPSTSSDESSTSPALDPAQPSPIDRSGDALPSAGPSKQVRWSDEGIADCAPSSPDMPTTLACPPALDEEECDWRITAGRCINATTSSGASSMPASPSRKRTCPTLDVFSTKRHEGPAQSRSDPLLQQLLSHHS
ncbi:hypothetical protein BCR37DRAFT_393746 [Protomyces lactucae-debilis]|uniref:Uncharacterized protein n=1 Tax=Protomyces lactucae-debilis TaxID=2754530 RepID=A0A1Y2F907_PROLT|nr:uncharacterized protein BCR37DRAFT_393746 [Protomyces lactucae-debilis]ORY80381.1 hypothetical protein BCR37DRAFT_393746 [Protomyces lactucae-debilis]